VNSIILRTATAFMLPLLLLASAVILLRGHNEPGGGFVGGLTAAAAFLLYLLAYGPARCRQLLPLTPEALIATGLGVALLSGVPALFVGEPLFTAVWTDFEPIPGVKVGTPLFFDIGVHLTVMGSVLLMLLSIAEWPRAGAAVDPGTDDADAAAAGEAPR
jgi:multicomponent Na+:H+ antiporter subunit B